MALSIKEQVGGFFLTKVFLGVEFNTKRLRKPTVSPYPSVLYDKEDDSKVCKNALSAYCSLSEIGVIKPNGALKDTWRLDGRNPISVSATLSRVGYVLADVDFPLKSRQIGVNMLIGALEILGDESLFNRPRTPSKRWKNDRFQWRNHLRAKTLSDIITIYTEGGRIRDIDNVLQKNSDYIESLKLGESPKWAADLLRIIAQHHASCGRLDQALVFIERSIALGESKALQDMGFPALNLENAKRTLIAIQFLKGERVSLGEPSTSVSKASYHLAEHHLLAVLLDDPGVLSHAYEDKLKKASFKVDERGSILYVSTPDSEPARHASEQLTTLHRLDILRRIASRMAKKGLDLRDLDLEKTRKQILTYSFFENHKAAHKMANDVLSKLLSKVLDAETTINMSDLNLNLMRERSTDGKSVLTEHTLKYALLEMRRIVFEHGVEVPMLPIAILYASLRPLEKLLDKISKVKNASELWGIQIGNLDKRLKYFSFEFKPKSATNIIRLSHDIEAVNRMRDARMTRLKQMLGPKNENFIAVLREVGNLGESVDLDIGGLKVKVIYDEKSKPKSGHWAWIKENGNVECFFDHIQDDGLRALTFIEQVVQKLGGVTDKPTDNNVFIKPSKFTLAVVSNSILWTLGKVAFDYRLPYGSFGVMPISAGDDSRLVVAQIIGRNPQGDQQASLSDTMSAVEDARRSPIPSQWRLLAAVLGQKHVQDVMTWAGGHIVPEFAFMLQNLVTISFLTSKHAMGFRTTSASDEAAFSVGAMTYGNQIRLKLTVNPILVKDAKQREEIEQEFYKLLAGLLNPVQPNA